MTPNDLIVVNQIEADVGDQIYLEKVRLNLHSLDNMRVHCPFIIGGNFTESSLMGHYLYLYPL